MQRVSVCANGTSQTGGEIDEWEEKTQIALFVLEELILVSMQLCGS